MVAKDGLLGTLSASELEFIAGNESIEIQPRANLGTLHLISDDYGPLRPNTNVAVPLWLALQLRKAQYCRVIAPQWMSVGHLQDLLTREISNKDDFQQIPFHYVEISTMLFEWYQWGSLSKRTESAAEDVPQAEQVRILIQNIREQRHAKIQAGLPMIDGNPLKLNNVGHMELNEIRPFLLSTLDHFTKIAQAESDEQNSRSNSYAPTPSYSPTTDLFASNKIK